MKKRHWLDPRRFYPKGRRKYHHYEPWYDEHADYNTNAPSYYDYLARFNHFIRVITDFINRLMRRNIETENTESINFTKKGDWIDNGECAPDDYNDIIKLSAVVNISKQVEELKLKNTEIKDFIINNGSKIKNDGLWSPDYLNVIEELDNELGRIQDNIDDLYNKVDNIEGDINNLYKEINNINIRLDSILGINLTRLTKGTDYDIVFYNDFYTDADNFIVEMIETDSTIDFTVRTSSTNDTQLKHDNINEVLMKHSSSYDEVPESHVFKIVLLGEYAQYNNHSILRSEAGNNLFNMRPVSARASWGAALSFFRQPDGYLVTWTSYSDGYNTQMDIYENEDLRLHHGNLNITMTIVK